MKAFTPFELRRLQPFHDFPEGPDWWTQDDWRMFVGQVVKLRINFIGLHTYPFHTAPTPSDSASTADQQPPSHQRHPLEPMEILPSS